MLQQGNSLTAIATSAALATGQLSLYGSSGPDVTELFAQPTVAVAFKIQSALTHHGNAVQGKKAIRAGLSCDLLTGSGTVTMTVDTEVTPNGTSRTMAVSSGFAVIGGSNDANNNPINAAGIYLGLTISGTLAGFTMTNGDRISGRLRFGRVSNAAIPTGSSDFQ